MINYDEIGFLKCGEKIYQRRGELEKIADDICGRGFQSILFTSVGGSQAMLDPFRIMLQEKTSIPVFSILSSELVCSGFNQISKNMLVFLASKSGTTEDTLAAARYLKKLGCTLVSVVGEPDSEFELISDYCFVYGDSRPQEMIVLFIIGRILYDLGEFNDYPVFADQLRYLPRVLCDVRRQFDAEAVNYCERLVYAPYQIWTASGELWPVCYAFTMCVLEESLWIRTKAVQSSEFFHGTFELVDKDVPIIVLVGEGKTRNLDIRVKEFAERYSDQTTIIDTRDFMCGQIDRKFKLMLTPVIMNAALQRIAKNMEAITGHSLKERRYYRKVLY